jgi:hypothetical protein
MSIPGVPTTKTAPTPAAQGIKTQQTTQINTTKPSYPPVFLITLDVEFEGNENEELAWGYKPKPQQPVRRDHGVLVEDQFVGSYEGQTHKKLFGQYEFKKAINFINRIREGNERDSQGNVIPKDIQIAVVNSYGSTFTRKNIYNLLFKIPFNHKTAEPDEREIDWNSISKEAWDKFVDPIKAPESEWKAFVESGKVSEKVKQTIIEGIKQGLFFNNSNREYNLKDVFPDLENLLEMPNVHVFNSASNAEDDFSLLSLAKGIHTTTEPDKGHSRSDFVPYEFPGNRVYDFRKFEQYHTSSANPGRAGEFMANLVAGHELNEYYENEPLLQKSLEGTGIIIKEKYPSDRFTIADIDQKDDKGKLIPKGDKIIAIINKETKRVAMKYFGYADDGFEVLEYDVNRKVHPIALRVTGKMDNLSGSFPKDLGWISVSNLPLEKKKHIVKQLIEINPNLPAEGEYWLPLFPKEEIKSITINYIKNHFENFILKQDFWLKQLQETSASSTEVREAVSIGLHSFRVKNILSSGGQIEVPERLEMKTISPQSKGTQAQINTIRTPSIHRKILDNSVQYGKENQEALLKILEKQPPEKIKNTIKNFLIYLTDPLSGYIYFEESDYINALYEKFGVAEKDIEENKIEDLRNFKESYIAKFQELQYFIDLAKKVTLNNSEIKEILIIKIQQSNKNPLEGIPTHILKKGQVPAPLKEFFTYEEINQIWLNRNSQVLKK